MHSLIVEDGSLQDGIQRRLIYRLPRFSNDVK